VDDRYHLCLTANGRPSMHGWWAKESTARGKFSEWKDARGRPGVRITLVDEETGETLTAWPDES
jgi:hypothetical protein